MREEDVHRHFSNIVAADISHNALHQSRKAHAEMKLTYQIAAEAQEGPFEGNIFDIVVITEVLEQVLDMQRAIDECYYILKGDSIFIIVKILLNVKGRWPRVIERQGAIS